ncbi:MAG: type I-C CRISPR-associated protein Cas7/Csd2 [Dethiobacter sp.]|nr:type I-C CRISPR-associated protein Cas7/Csd2 [Dethiobacter sp.]
MSLTNKIDFAMVFTVKKANPNGDPLNGNRPRIDYDGYGEVSDVCLKRKLRNRLQDLGEAIFVQSDNNRRDDYRSLNARFEGNKEIKGEGDKEKKAKIACKTWFDVRAFGQVFAFKAKNKKGKNSDSEEESGESDSVSIGVRGPVTIQSAVSVETVVISSLQITKSVNLETDKNDPAKRAPDTMGMKHRVDFGVYKTFGSINYQLAEKTGFSDADADKLLDALKTLFVNDASAARPDGSMEIVKVIWWKHNCKIGQYSSATVHRSLKIDVSENSILPKVTIEPLAGLKPEMYDGESLCEKKHE